MRACERACGRVYVSVHLLNITIAIKYEVEYALSISLFRFDLSPRGQGQCREHFRREYLENVTDRANITTVNK